MENWIGLVIVSPFLGAFCSGGHTLLVFATLIKGETPFPEFSAVLMLDDIQVAYYDSFTKKAFQRGPNSTDPEDDEDLKDFKRAVEHYSGHMQNHILSLKYHFNKTDGIQSLQRLTGCELLGNDTEGLLILMEAFDGIGGDMVYYNKHEALFVADWKWPINSQADETYLKYFVNKLCNPLCMEMLRNYLRREKYRIGKQVKPNVRLLQKTLPHSGVVLMTCLATGFYPRHINLTLLRDGQPVSDHKVTGGELLPNGDETYQMRKSLEFSAEELQHHYYTCTAEHLSLDRTEPQSDNLPPLSLLVILPVALCVIFAIIVFIIWKRQRGRTDETHLQTM